MTASLKELLITDPLDVISIMQQFKDEGAPCKYKHWKWVNGKTGEISRFCCNSWECGECRPIVAERASRHANSGEADWLLTITNVPDNREECRSKWQQYMRALRQGYGKRLSSWMRLKCVMSGIAEKMGKKISATEWRLLRSESIRGHRLEYFRVLERGGKHGMRHYHVLVRGPWIPHLLAIGMASLFGFGQVGNVKEVYSDGVGYYLGKYLTKSGGEYGWRKTGSSRGYCQKRSVDLDADWRLSRPDPGSLVSVDELERMEFRDLNERAKGLHKTPKGVIIEEPSRRIRLSVEKEK